MTDRVLVCTDLDRTLLPNGALPESPGARDLFCRLAARAETRVAYVSGRHRELVEDAIKEYQLPRPDFVIGDVGTSIYTIHEDDWQPWSAWEQLLSSAWKDMDGPGMLSVFQDIVELKPQEDAKQGQFKCSFYAPVSTDIATLQQQLKQRLDRLQRPSRIIWSIDDNRQLGLVDILPEHASKLHAIRFLMQEKGFDRQNTLFSGDSGNDLEVLTSDIPSVLVANASEEVRTQAMRLCDAAGTRHAFYAAHGGFLGMNGNYSAGILEGLAHYLPETSAWFQ